MLNSYHQGYEWADDIVRGIQDTLRGDRLELAIEYFDARRSKPGWNALMRRYLQSKYPHNSIDAIIASDDAAVEFLIAQHHDLFPAVPVIFAGLMSISAPVSTYVTAMKHECGSRAYLSKLP